MQRYVLFFFFQAEDGIRDYKVTGVQTCALPISARARFDGIKVQLLTGGPLALFAQQLPAATPINLLQGSYAPTAARAVGLRAWRVAAILLMSLVSLHLVGKIGELQLLKSRERQLDASIRDTFHAAMPGDP